MKKETLPQFIPIVRDARIEDISALAHLSHEAFESARPRPEEFERLLNEAHVRVVYSKNGELYAYAVTLKQADPQSEVSFVRHLPPDFLYAKGAAVRKDNPKTPGVSLHRILLRDRLIEAGVLEKKVGGTVRPTNGRSAYNISETNGIFPVYAEGYYSQSKTFSGNPDRLFFVQDPKLETPHHWLRPIISSEVLKETDEVKRALARENPSISLPIRNGNGFDERAQPLIQSILSPDADYIGVRLNFLGEKNTQGDDMLGMRFIHLDTLPQSMARYLRDQKQQIHDVV